MAKILLVEDDSNLREIYGARLEAEGYQIVSANDGEEALAIAVREKPDLIVSDIMMPKISGFDMLDILRSTPETKNVKVIVMTALSQEEDKQRGEQLGADRYVVKSQVTLDDVVSIVREVLGNIQPTPTPVQPNIQPDDQTGDLSDSAQTAQPQNQIAAEPNITPADAEMLNKEVEQFVATSPLMNGTPPQSQPPVEPVNNSTQASPSEPTPPNGL